MKVVPTVFFFVVVVVVVGVSIPWGIFYIIVYPHIYTPYIIVYNPYPFSSTPLFGQKEGLGAHRVWSWDGSMFNSIYLYNIVYKTCLPDTRLGLSKVDESIR